MTDLQEIEVARRRAQDRLDLTMGLAQRNRTGQYATPGPLAVQIMEHAWRNWEHRPDKVRFLEPAFGTGAFYSALLQVLPPGRLERALGVELDREHVKASRNLWKDGNLELVCGDFLRQEPPGPKQRFNLLLTNPPYVRHHHIGREEKQRLQALVLRRLGIKISGLAGLYCYFMLLADQWLSDGALSVWLVPSEFLDVNYGIAVKRYLKENTKLVEVHRFHAPDVQFDDALVSSAVVVFEKKAAPAGHRLRFSLGGSLDQPQVTEEVAPLSLAVSEKWTQHPIISGRENGRKPGGRVLGDLFTIKRGLATGANRFFILERAEAQAKGIPAEYLRPILPNPRQLPGAIIEGAPDGYPVTEPQLALIDCRVSEEEIRERHPQFWAYLEEGRAQGIAGCYLASHRSPWYSQEDRPAAPFLCTYMGRAQNGRKPFRFLWNQSAATAHNVYLLLYPKGALKAALDEDPDLARVVFQALREIDTIDFMGEGRVYGGGLYKMEPKELGKISADGILEAMKERLVGAGMARELPFFG